MMNFPELFDAFARRAGHSGMFPVLKELGHAQSKTASIRGWKRGLDDAAAGDAADLLRLKGRERQAFLDAAAVHYLLSATGLKARGAKLLREYMEGVEKRLQEAEAIIAETQSKRR